MTLKTKLTRVAKTLGVKKQPRVQKQTSRREERLAQIERLGNVDLSTVVNQENGLYVSADPFAKFVKSPLSRHELLANLHQLLQPRTYFEIGIEYGLSLRYSRAKTIAVDPGFSIVEEINCDVRLHKMKSDDFFNLPEAFAHFASTPIDLAFIDGMHLSEFALRDFINTEKHSSQSSVIVFDDVLPRNNLEAYRIRRTGEWAGDVYKIINVLRTYRPDLVVIPLNTSPTGTMLVTNLNPSSTILEDNLANITAELTTPDPQIVDPEFLHRTIAIDPRLLLASDAISQLAHLRDREAEPEEYTAVWEKLRAIPRIEETTN